MKNSDYTRFSLNPLTQEEFAQLDYCVMRYAFESQNHLGRLCEEVIYQNDLAARLEAMGLSVAKEVLVRVTHRDFAKSYWLDLVVANAVIYELKTAQALVGEHDAQLLNYLFLCGSHHGKLINFRPGQVESRFINATISQTERRKFAVELDNWEERNRTDQAFRENLLDLLANWGCRLDLALYTEALIHFSGGEGLVLQRLPLVRGEVNLGEQCFHLLNPETAFRVTALTEGTEDYERQLRSLLRLSRLRTMYWVNFIRQRVQLITLTR